MGSKGEDSVSYESPSRAANRPSSQARSNGKCSPGIISSSRSSLHSSPSPASTRSTSTVRLRNAVRRCVCDEGILTPGTENSTGSNDASTPNPLVAAYAPPPKAPVANIAWISLAPAPPAASNQTNNRQRGQRNTAWLRHGANVTAWPSHGGKRGRKHSRRTANAITVENAHGIQNGVADIQSFQASNRAIRIEK